MFIWMAKFGAAYGVRSGSHVGGGVFVARVPEARRNRVILFGLMCGALFTGVGGRVGLGVGQGMYLRGQRSKDLEGAMGIVYMAIPLGSGLMCFRFLQVAWSFFHTGELPHHDASHVEGLETKGAAPMDVGRPWRHGNAVGLVLILAPLLIFLMCLAQQAGVVEFPQGIRAAIIFLLLIALMLTGMPISIALGLTVFVFLFTLTDVPVASVALKLFTGIERFEIMAVPFFILGRAFLTHGGVARRMIDFATSVIGHWHGGLALAGIVACAMFALVCGSSVATVVAIGTIVLPEMVRHGYPMRFGAGVITVAGSLGILMLPSIPKVIYAIATGTSIGALFVAGVLPGTLG